MVTPTHHAYLCEGPRALLEVLVRDATRRFGFGEHGDPDVRTFSYEQFGIDEARALRQAAILKSTAGKGLVIVATSSLGAEAQQALLKLFEEPQPGVILILLAPHGSVIPTLRSRMLLYPEVLEAAPGFDRGAKEFLRSSGSARSAQVAKLLKDDEGVRDRVRTFLNALERALYPLLKKGTVGVREGMEDIMRVRGYVGDRAPAYKMLLEHLAVSLPQLQASRAEKEG